MQQRYTSALSSLCFLGWHQHVLQQRQDPHSRNRLRQRLLARTGGWCRSAQDWRRVVLLRKALGGWLRLMWRGAIHYRCVVLTGSMISHASAE